MAATIVVACSDQDNCGDWEALLARFGYEVVFARNEDTALFLCSRLRPDLLLLDENLPDLRLENFRRRLRQNSANERTPVVHVKSAAEEVEKPATLRPEVREIWGPVSTPLEMFERVHFLDRLKTYIDEETHAVVFGLVRAIEARDRYEAEHAVRVSNHAVRLGASLGLSAIEIDALRIGGLLHDIGKVAVPDNILSKPGRLNAEETSKVRQHPVVGEQICAPLKSLRHVLPLIRHHHERMDGSGYPDGLRGAEIPITAQVLHLADICDALTSDRPYRRSMSLPSALLCLYHDAERGWIDERLVRQMAILVLGMEQVSRGARHIAFRPPRYRSGAGPS